VTVVQLDARLRKLMSSEPIFTRADTVCGGKGWRVYELTEKVCDVGAYHESLLSMRDVPVATIVTAYEHTDGRTLILAAPQALFFGDTMDASLIPPAQLQSHGLVVDTCLKQFSKGKSLHGIYVPERDLFHSEGCILYLPIRLPTDAEMDTSEWVWLTSEDEWNPYSTHFDEAERVFDRVDPQIYPQNITMIMVVIVSLVKPHPETIVCRCMRPLWLADGGRV
jgi:hypothetical protein